MNTNDLIFCTKCGVYHNINYVERKTIEWSNSFNWTCAVCKTENYEEN